MGEECLFLTVQNLSQSLHHRFSHVQLFKERFNCGLQRDSLQGDADINSSFIKCAIWLF